MSYHIDIEYADLTYEVDEQQLLKAIAAVLEQEAVASQSNLTVYISDNDHIRSLNKQYRGVDAATDVLSFPSDMPEVDLPAGLAAIIGSYLGDLVVAYPFAAEQAERLECDLQDNLAVLVMHGTLHLLGYDHGTDAERKVMWDAQSRAMGSIGLSRALLPAHEGDIH